MKNEKLFSLYSPEFAVLCFFLWFFRILHSLRCLHLHRTLYTEFFLLTLCVAVITDILESLAGSRRLFEFVEKRHAYLCGARMSREASKPPLSYPRSVWCVRTELSRWNRCLIEFKLLNMQQQRTRHIAHWKLHLPCKVERDNDGFIHDTTRVQELRD